MCFMEIMTNLYFFGVIHTQCKLSQPSLQTDFSPPPPCKTRTSLIR